jgi:hypothetical protein
MNTEQFDGHTPAPWVAQCGSVYTKASVGEDGYATVCVARMDREEPSTVPTERDANARLIAAAPDLLAEVKRLREENKLVWKYVHFERMYDDGLLTVEGEFIDSVKELIE